MSNTQPPFRVTSGITSDPKTGPFADCGAGNPMFYHTFEDDFDNSLATTGEWTKTLATTGTVAETAGDGGLALFTTAATNADNVSIQTPVATFSLTAGKKLFFETSLQLSDITASAFQAGLIQATTTPATVTDGIWFSKASGTTNIFINHAVGSVLTQAQIPASAFSPFANATVIQLAFYLDRNANILAFADNQLVGFVPTSGTGTNTPPSTGAVARIIPAALTTANLAVTLALQAGAAAVKTMTVDFVCASKER